MIGALSGTILNKTENTATVMVGGVGYEVRLSPTLLGGRSVGDEAQLLIHTYVREDALELYGFEDQEQLKMFRLLLDISGVGPSTALAVVDRGTESVREAIINADVDFFKSVPRVGKKCAQKIIIELKPKLGDLVEIDLAGEATGETAEVIEALVVVGFSRREALEAVRKLPDGLATVEEKVKEALKLVGKR